MQKITPFLWFDHARWMARIILDRRRNWFGK